MCGGPEGSADPLAVGWASGLTCPPDLPESHDCHDEAPTRDVASSVLAEEVERRESLTMNGRRYLTAGLVLLAIGVRVAAVLVLQSHRVPRSTYEHGEIAANMLAGRGFAVHFLGPTVPLRSRPRSTPRSSPWPMRSGVSRSPVAAHLGARPGGARGILVLGVLGLAEAVTGGRPLSSLVAGVIASLYPTLVYAATHVQVALWGRPF